jgi:hypothetical protein
MSPTYPSNISPLPQNTTMSPTYPRNISPLPHNTTMSPTYPSNISPLPHNTTTGSLERVAALSEGLENRAASNVAKKNPNH